MESTKSSKKKTSKAIDDQAILEAYKHHLLKEGKQPASIYSFCAALDIKEEVFYDHFGSFDAIDKAIWKAFATSTLQKLNADAAFAEFSAREKLLTFYFALAEVLKSNRSYILLVTKHHKFPEFNPAYIKDFKTSFESFVEQIIGEGISREEVAKRPFVDKRYPNLFWIHMTFFLMFWKDDNSKGFEKTDAFVEKSINLAFDLIGKGAIDSAIDFLKFLYQAKAYA
ncbi:TetR/AcrR family transcriptional regulator [Chryseotalea sanaruensis]|uniref:TetR/AcrR family transcriptional regulator n=1 Tax=Chryseotalea sanaruensis TaxID=2482724 RepID=A0A401UE16_9BACT|nr:TetR/AcrR family transcriptional regulator [Chryseotalea sanaruensis]GCC53117.1 TetR/AcrR family transcriptional regulator [Chryseotalea sanaruensis]